MDKDTINRKCAEALGIPSHVFRVSHDEQQASSLDPCEVEGCGQIRIAHRSLDFFTDETANAMLLDELIKHHRTCGMLLCKVPNPINLMGDLLVDETIDRKEHIIKAFIAWKEQP